MSLHFVVGLPGSGKSTLAKTLLTIGVVDEIISTDAIRERIITFYGTSSDPYFDPTIETDVWSEATGRIDNLLLYGLEPLLDSTNLKPQDRRKWLDLATQQGVGATAHLLGTSVGASQLRNRDRTRVVPENVMNRMIRDWNQNCSPETLRAEGFEVVIHWTKRGDE